MKNHNFVLMVLVLVLFSTSAFAKGSLKAEFDSIMKRSDDFEQKFYRQIVTNPAKPMVAQMKHVRDFDRELARWSKLTPVEQKAEERREREESQCEAEKADQQWQKDKAIIAENDQLLERHMQDMETPEETEARHVELEHEADARMAEDEREIAKIQKDISGLERLIKVAEDSSK